jgi:hypothetical protein
VGVLRANSQFRAASTAFDSGLHELLAHFLQAVLLDKLISEMLDRCPTGSIAEFSDWIRLKMGADSGIPSTDLFAELLASLAGQTHGEENNTAA